MNNFKLSPLPFLGYLLALFLFSTCAPSIIIKNVSRNTDIKGVSRYALPKNMIRVEISTNKKESTPGKYSWRTGSTAEDTAINRVLLNLYHRMGFDSTYIKPNQKGVSYKLKSLTLADTSLVDQEQIYEVFYKRKLNKKNSFTSSISDRSIIQGIKIEETDQTFELVTQFVSAAATIGASFLSGDPLFLKGDTTNLDTIAQYTIFYSVQHAAFLAKELVEISKERKALEEKYRQMSAFKDYTFYKKALSILKQKEKELKSWFTVKEKSKTIKLVLAVDFDSVKDTLNKVPLFYIDPKKGVEAASDIQQLYSDTSGLKLGELIDTTKYYYSYHPIKEQVISDSTGFESNDKTKHGLRYRIPLQINFEIFKKTTTKGLTSEHRIASKTSSIAQLGTVVQLPTKLNIADLTYIESLGLLKSISISSTGLNKDSLGPAAEAAKKVIGLQKTEVERLQEEVTKLELQKKKRDLQKELEQDN